jgi:hypothetical protein
MAWLLSLFITRGCRFSLVDEVRSLIIKRNLKLGHLDLGKVATGKTFLSRLHLHFPDIEIRSTNVTFPSKPGHPSQKFTVFVFDLIWLSSGTCSMTSQSLMSLKTECQF